MPQSQSPAQSPALAELDTDACWALLEAHTFGRIGYVDSDGPVVLPVNYAAHDRQLWIRTASYSQLAVHLPGERVAFEIDLVQDGSDNGADGGEHRGWSVLVRGRAEHVLAGHGDHADGRSPAPWPAGVRSMELLVVVGSVTGRRLGPA